MKVVILCGGQGTRIRDVSEVLPKPMLPIGSRPILWHIMKIYAHYGFKDFILCLGYKGWLVKEFFLNYHAQTSDVTLTLGNRQSIEYHGQSHEADWKITLVDTGEDSQTARRIWMVREFLNGDQNFCVTYGDGVADVNIKALIDSHKKSGQTVTLTGVQPSGRFGEIETDGAMIREFNEKPNVSTGLINGGFMVFKTSVIKDYLKSGANLSLESDVLPAIVKKKKAGIYKHPGSWQCVDTPREYNLLNSLWAQKKAFWKLAK